MPSMGGYGGQILNEASSLLQNIETVSYQLLDNRTPVYTQQNSKVMCIGSNWVDG